ncbi:hypothetical protein KPL74_04745 [Bacillus sp. NP157]|nr:hypothetical protein KPL74_04745 [Bacillus sp. NP157]
MDRLKLHVDFNNCDADGAIRLSTKGVADSLARDNVQLVEGMAVEITDGEIFAVARIALHDGFCVAVFDEWSYVDEERVD